MLFPMNVRWKQVKVNELIKKSVEILKKDAGITCVLDVRLIIKYVLNIDDIGLVLYADKDLDEKICQEIFRLIGYRAQGMPVQYIIGKQEFMSLDFKVEKGVLIPRHDTEILVESIIDEVKKERNDKIIKILDIGTGTGCIAVSLAHYIPNSIAYAIDVSETALELARLNAKENNVSERIHFIRHNVLEGSLSDEINTKMDIIVSNPPYIPTDTIRGLQREVKDYEPIIALDGGDDGLVFYEKITSQARELLLPKGLLAFEVGCGQSSSVIKIFNEKKLYTDIEIVKDLAGIERVVKARSNVETQR